MGETKGLIRNYERGSPGARYFMQSMQSTRVICIDWANTIHSRQMNITRKCLSRLRSLFANDLAAIDDEIMLAATIVLKLLKRIDVSVSGSDPQYHLVGIEASVSIQDVHTIMPGRLRLTCFFVALHYPSLESTDDHTWANRIVVHQAHVIQFAFDPDADRSARRFEELDRYSKAWKASLSTSFQPIFCAPAGISTEDSNASPAVSSLSGRSHPRYFPQIWHIGCDAILVALQHHLFASILLAPHNSTLRRLKPAHLSASAAVDEYLRAAVMGLAGLAVCNPHPPPSLFAACMVTQLCGESFSEREV
ncbi:MAG: hypothetical protein MMC23_009076 [Stictis urceolatum]|nr:hypothetical protein [Stictis urceolata]